MARHICRDSDHIHKLAWERHFAQWQTVWRHGPNAGLAGRRNNPNLLYKSQSGEDVESDAIEFPDPAEDADGAGTEEHHEYRVPTANLFLRLRILKDDFTAIADAPYTLRATGSGATDEHEGTTDENGQIRVRISETAQEAELTVRIPFEDSDDPNAAEAPAEGEGEGGDAAAEGGAAAEEEEEDIFETGPLQGEVPITWQLKIGALNPIMEEAPTELCISGVQQRLNNLALNAGPVTGVLDANTRAAVTAFQRLFELEPNGQPDQAQFQPKLKEVHDDPDSIQGPAPEPAEESGGDDTGGGGDGGTDDAEA